MTSKLDFTGIEMNCTSYGSNYVSYQQLPQHQWGCTCYIKHSP